MTMSVVIALLLVSKSHYVQDVSAGRWLEHSWWLVACWPEYLYKRGAASTAFVPVSDAVSFLWRFAC